MQLWLVQAVFSLGTWLHQDTLPGVAWLSRSFVRSTARTVGLKRRYWVSYSQLVVAQERKWPFDAGARSSDAPGRAG